MGAAGAFLGRARLPPSPTPCAGSAGASPSRPVPRTARKPGGPQQSSLPAQTSVVARASWLAASRRSVARSVFSQVNSGSERPKWPPLAVLR